MEQEDVCLLVVVDHTWVSTRVLLDFWRPSQPFVFETLVWWLLLLLVLLCLGS